MSVKAELNAQGVLLRSHLAAAGASVNVMKVTVDVLQHSPHADEKDRFALKDVMKQVNAAAAALKDLDGRLKGAGLSVDSGRGGGGP